MDPGLAGVTAYVSQDCTGMKDEAAVDKTGSWALRQNRPLFSSGVFVLLFKAASGTSFILQQSHQRKSLNLLLDLPEKWSVCLFEFVDK